MKKAITIFLAAALMLSLAACGGNSNTPSSNTPSEENSTERIKEIVTLEDWIDAVGGVGTLKFNNDGTGKLSAYVMSWEIQDNTITVTWKDPNNTERKSAYNFDAEDDIVKLIGKNDAIYVPVSNYEVASVSIRGEITDNAQELDVLDLTATLLENKAKAELNYQDQLFKLTATVINVDSDRCRAIVEVATNEYVHFYIFLDKQTLASLSDDDVITVVGRLTYLSDVGEHWLTSAFLADKSE